MLLASRLSQPDGWASEKVCMRCESAANMTGPSVLTASSRSLARICCRDVSRVGPTAVRDRREIPLADAAWPDCVCVQLTQITARIRAAQQRGSAAATQQRSSAANIRRYKQVQSGAAATTPRKPVSKRRHRPAPPVSVHLAGNV